MYVSLLQTCLPGTPQYLINNLSYAQRSADFVQRSARNTPQKWIIAGNVPKHAENARKHVILMSDKKKKYFHLEEFLY
jgi:hypothetical protein